MALRPRIAVLLTLLACALPSAGAAESRVTVRIATQSPLSAEQAARGDEIRLGAQLALEQLGGPLERLGFRLELAAFDDQGRPDIAVANAKNIVASKEILAVIGHLDGRVAIPASEIYKEVSLAMIAPAGTDTLLTDRGLPGVNRVSGRDDVQGTAAAIFATTTLAAKSVYVLHDATTAGQDVAKLFRAEAARRGVRILGFEGTDERAEFDPAHRSAQGPGPGSRLLRGSPRAGGAVLAAGARAGREGAPPGLGRLGLAGLRAAGRRRQPWARTTRRSAACPQAGPVSPPSAGTSAGDSAGSPGSSPPGPTTPPPSRSRRSRPPPRAATLPGREAVAAAVRRVKLVGVTGEVELDAKGDRKKAVYSVFQVAGADPERWEQNRVVKQVVVAAPSGN